jgi:hypothetical protein
MGILLLYRALEYLAQGLLITGLWLSNSLKKGPDDE